MALKGFVKGVSAVVETGADLSKGLKGASTVVETGADLSKGLKSAGAGLETGSKTAKTASSFGDKLKSFKEAADTAADSSKVTKVADTAADTAAGSSKATKVADTAADAGTTTKTLDKTVQNTVKEGMEEAASNSKNQASFMAKYSKYGKYVVGGITVATISTIAGVNSEKINKTKYTITSIKKDQKNPSYTIITYTPNDKFNDNDTITITDSDSAESIDGEKIPIHDAIEAGVIKINKSIKVEGTKGNLRCQTNFGNQFSNTLNDIADPVITEVVNVGSDIAENVLDKTFKELGLPTPSDIIDNIKQYWWVILLVSLVPIILSSILFVITQLI